MSYQKLKYPTFDDINNNDQYPQMICNDEHYTLCYLGPASDIRTLSIDKTNPITFVYHGKASWRPFNVTIDLSHYQFDEIIFVYRNEVVNQIENISDLENFSIFLKLIN